MIFDNNKDNEVMILMKNEVKLLKIIMVMASIRLMMLMRKNKLKLVPYPSRRRRREAMFAEDHAY